jgi:hypothetical protein
LERFATAFAAQPVAFILVFAAIAGLAGMACLDIVRRRGDRAFWAVVGLLLIGLAPAFGEDIDHHVYRIVALAEQVRSGQLSLLLANPANGEALPTFVYYSFVPYLPAVVLNLAGLSAHLSFKLILAAELLVMAFGLRRLTRHIAPGAEARHAACLIAILFLCANYVYALWLQRMAFAEIWVYCLIPWIALALARPGALVALVAPLFFQISGHPIVFAQSFLCSLLLAWAVSSDGLMAILRRAVPAAAIALVLASPFWLPQFLWQALILGPAGLPVRFADSFLSAGELFDRRFTHGMGFGLPLAVVLMIALVRARLSVRTWTLVAAFVLAMAIQTRALSPLAERLPLLPTSLFVWRLMLPAALLGFAALWAGWQARRDRDRLLAAVTVLSFAGMLVVLIGGMPASLALAAEPRDDQSWYRSYLEKNLVWGRAEFLPNYGAVPRACDLPASDVQAASFAELQRGVAARSIYIAVPQAPVGIVSYSADNAAVPLAACGEHAIFGPLKPGAVLKVSQDKLTALLYGRIASVLICAVGFVLLAGLGWPNRGTR